MDVAAVLDLSLYSGEYMHKVTIEAVNKSITSQCYISIPHKNFRKFHGVLFSGDIETYIGQKWVNMLNMLNMCKVKIS